MDRQSGNGQSSPGGNGLPTGRFGQGPGTSWCTCLRLDTENLRARDLKAIALRNSMARQGQSCCVRHAGPRIAWTPGPAAFYPAVADAQAEQRGPRLRRGGCSPSHEVLPTGPRARATLLVRVPDAEPGGGADCEYTLAGSTRRPQSTAAAQTHYRRAAVPIIAFQPAWKKIAGVWKRRSGANWRDGRALLPRRPLNRLRRGGRGRCSSKA